MTDHYKTLGIESSADARQIKRAYFDLVKQFPPERFPEKFKEIRAAYDTLSNEGKRAQYDKTAALPESAAFLAFEAKKAKQQGRLDQAQDIYRMILYSYPELSVIREEYAATLEMTGKTGKATDEWEALCEQAPDNVGYIASLARCYSKRGWRRKAIAAYTRALDLDSGDADCWAALLDCHLDGDEFDEVSIVSQLAVNALRNKGNESIYIYTQAVVFEPSGDLARIEGYLKDIARLTRAGITDVTETQSSVFHLLEYIEKMDLMAFFPYIREIADSLPYMEEKLRDMIANVELGYEASKLEEEGFSPLFYDLFELLAHGCKCESCTLDLAAMEYAILMDLNAFRPQLLRLKNDYPQFFAMHAAFFNEAILIRDPDRMLYPRYKKLSKQGLSPKLNYNDDDPPPVQQTVRREGPKTGRNDPCPCGSGKKYKKCCGA